MHQTADEKVPTAPILDHKFPDASSVSTAGALLREARRQKGLAIVDVPAICILDPDGDILRHLQETGRAKRFVEWPWYHTDLYTFQLGSERVGIIANVVEAPFAVLIAEELFTCGCRLLLSLTANSRRRRRLTSLSSTGRSGTRERVIITPHHRSLQTLIPALSRRPWRP